MTFKRLTPQQVVLGIGIVFGIITAISGIAAEVFSFSNDSEEHREVFVNIPDVLRLAFYTILPVLIVYGAWMFSLRVKNWRRGGPDNRATTTKNAATRLKDFRSGVYMQTLLREPGAGVMHAMMYFSFVVLLGVTTVLEIDHQMPSSLKFLHGGTYKGYALVGDLAGLVFTVSIVWAILRRYGPRAMRPYRIRIKSRPEHAVILDHSRTVVRRWLGQVGCGPELRLREPAGKCSVRNRPLHRPGSWRYSRRVRWHILSRLGSRGPRWLSFGLVQR